MDSDAFKSGCCHGGNPDASPEVVLPNRATLGFREDMAVVRRRVRAEVLGEFIDEELWKLDLAAARRRLDGTGVDVATVLGEGLFDLDGAVEHVEVFESQRTGKRVPSMVTADRIIAVLPMTMAEQQALRDAAVTDRGKSRPGRWGWLVVRLR